MRYDAEISLTNYISAVTKTAESIKLRCENSYPEDSLLLAMLVVMDILLRSTVVIAYPGVDIHEGRLPLTIRDLEMSMNCTPIFMPQLRSVPMFKCLPP